MSAKDISGKRPNQKRYSDHYYGPKKIQRWRIELRIEENVWLNGCVPYPIYSNVAKKRSTSCGYWKPHKCLICKKAFCHEDSLKQHSVDVHDEKKAPISKKKKSKKKNKHLKDKNVEDISDHYYGIGHLNDNEKRINFPFFKNTNVGKEEILYSAQDLRGLLFNTSREIQTSFRLLGELASVYVAVPKQNTEYQYWKHTEVSLPV